MEDINKKFSFYIPAVNFSLVNKGEEKNNSDSPVMRIKGIASTTAVDSDNEILIPSGFKLDRFIRSGFINYNHLMSQDAQYIIGEPTKAYVEKNDFHIEGYLYENNKLAHSVFNTAKMLEKDSKTRRLGYSVEGITLEKDKNNPKKITKAEITAVAVTPTPKNPKTILEIAKGEGSIYDNMEFDDVAISINKSINKKAIAVNSGDSNFDEMTVESVERVRKKPKKREKDDNDDSEFNKSLNHGEIYIKIFSKFTNEISKAKKIKGIIEKISLMEGSEITDETIEKAYQILNKADKMRKMSHGKHSMKGAYNDKMPKESHEDVDDIDDIDEEGGDVKEMDLKKNKKGYGMKKSDGFENVASLVSDQILKSISPQMSALGTLFEAAEAREKELQKSINSQGAIISELGRRLNIVEKQKPDRKAILNSSYLEKGDAHNASNNGHEALTRINIENPEEKEHLKECLIKAGFDEEGKIVKSIYAEAAQNLETINHLANNQFGLNQVLKAIKNDFKIQVVKESY